MTDFACPPSLSDVASSLETDEPITVECVHGDSATLEAVAAGLDAHDRFSVERSDDPSAVLDRVQPLDCVVTDGETGPELLARIRERDPTLPVVLYTDAPLEPLLEGVVDAGWVDVVRPDAGTGSLDLLAHRLCGLVDHRRTATLARRATAAAEAATEGIAVVAPDGTIAFENSQLDRQFGCEPGELAGRPWRELFTDEAVARLESDALTAVDDGWQWIGTCEGRRADGRSVTLRTRVSDAADGELVFAVFQQSADVPD